MSFKYRKKPIVIEAVQYKAEMGTDTDVIPAWLLVAVRDGVIFVRGVHTYIRTLEGDMQVSEDDWIIRGVKGELYPCKPDIFEELYEKELR